MNVTNIVAFAIGGVVSSAVTYFLVKKKYQNDIDEYKRRVDILERMLNIKRKGQEKKTVDKPVEAPSSPVEDTYVAYDKMYDPAESESPTDDSEAKITPLNEGAQPEIVEDYETLGNLMGYNEENWTAFIDPHTRNIMFVDQNKQMVMDPETYLGADVIKTIAKSWPQKTGFSVINSGLTSIYEIEVEEDDEE
jgi:hypothetical protein